VTTDLYKNGNGVSSRVLNFSALTQPLKNRWEKLCARYLPVIIDNSIWRYNRAFTSEDPEQGWKLHISAIVLTASKILEKVAPVLSDSGVLFKAAGSLEELNKLNCGLFYGFSQIGKFITVYPKNPEQALFLARKLHRLTYGSPAPAVPYDQPFREGGCVYYRYGAFNALHMQQEDGTSVPAVITPEGQLVPDLREPGAAVPIWATDPFLIRRRSKKPTTEDSPLKTTYLAYEAMSQRGKGGVYRALDLSVIPARLCVLKEGRRNGETDWDGRDGYWRVRHEARVLSSLSLAGIKVPRKYSEFEVENSYYLVTEFIEGESLQSLLTKRKRMAVSKAIEYGTQLAGILQKVHSAGWVWRDCKPLNLILTKEAGLRPLDFEGACPVDLPDKMPWGTAGYAPFGWLVEPATGSLIPDDLYAFGATLHHLLTGEVPDSTYPPPALGKLKRRVSRAITQLVYALLDPDPRSRPGTCEAVRVLESA
jgi:hypothetical protein